MTEEATATAPARSTPRAPRRMRPIVPSENMAGRALVLVTPIGGIAFLAGWLALAFSAWTLKNGG